MTDGDILGLLAVYLYVALLLLITEKVLQKHPYAARKFLHMMVGNIFLILPLFDHAWVMAFLAAAPFIPLTFLMSPRSPVRLVSRTSSAGHGMGLVYYSISWTILAYLFFKQPHIIAVGIVAMSYGDGLASVAGWRYGRIKYRVLGETKSLEGSLTMAGVTCMASLLALLYYGVRPSLLLLVVISLAAALVEALTPRGLDNLTVPLFTSFLYSILSGVV